jgi:hypothetical protein
LAFDEELQEVGMPRQLKDILRIMLVVYPFKKPSAASVLVSREVRELEKLVGV